MTVYKDSLFLLFACLSISWPGYKTFRDVSLCCNPGNAGPNVKWYPRPVMPPGRFSNDNGNCESCPTGKFASNASSVLCNNCHPGKFAGESGSEFCQSCPQGMYASGYGSITCASCTECERLEIELHHCSSTFNRVCGYKRLAASAATASVMLLAVALTLGQLT